MIKIISKYHKKLHFQVGDKSVGINPNEITSVENEIGEVLLLNPWIAEIKKIQREIQTKVKKRKKVEKKLSKD